MAQLSGSQRKEILIEWMELLSKSREPISLTKAEMLDAINSLDRWMELNAALIDAEIPTKARGSLTAEQKAQLLSLITAKRYEKGA